MMKSQIMIKYIIGIQRLFFVCIYKYNEDVSNILIQNRDKITPLMTYYLSVSVN